MAENKKDMENFGGFGEAADISFFGDEPAPQDTPAAKEEDTTDTPPSDTEAEKEESEETKETKKETNDETEEDDFFSSSDIEEDEAEGEEEETNKPDKKNEVAQGSNVAFLNQLKERGLAEFELEEGEELTDDKAAELIEDSYEAGMEQRISEMMAELPPVTRDLLKYAVKGGDEKEFLSKLTKQPSVTSITKDMDLTDEKNQELIIRKQLESEDHDAEYIESNIEFLKESGKLENLSKKYHGKIMERDEKQRQADIKAVEDRKKRSKESLRQFKSGLTEHLKSTEEYKGFKFNESDAKSLPSYISDPKVKTDNGDVSEFQRDLFNVLQDKEKSILLAKLIKTDFDFSPLEKSTKTKQTKKIQDDVRRTSTKSSGSSRPRKGKQFLADFFSDE